MININDLIYLDFALVIGNKIVLSNRKNKHGIIISFIKESSSIYAFSRIVNDVK
jgi:hypothetical protein